MCACVWVCVGMHFQVLYTTYCFPTGEGGVVISSSLCAILPTSLFSLREEVFVAASLTQ